MTEAEQSVILNVSLDGIRNNEQRPTVGLATLTYAHAYTGETTKRDLDIPLITGYAPLRLIVALASSADPDVLILLGQLLVAESVIAAAVTAIAVWRDVRLSRERKISLTACLVLLPNVAAIAIHFAVLSHAMTRERT